MFGLSRIEMITVIVIIIFVFLLLVLLIAKILLFFFEKMRIYEKWAHSYRRKEDGSIELFSMDGVLLDTIPNGSKCFRDLPDFPSIGLVKIFFLTKEKKRKGSFYVRPNTRKKIENILLKKWIFNS